MPGLGQRPLPCHRFISVLAADRHQRLAQIRGGARQRTGHWQIVRFVNVGVDWRRRVAAHAHQIDRGFVTVKPAEMSGDANRSSDIAADRQKSETRGERRCASARRSAG